jgi:hypothetical protein
MRLFEPALQPQGCKAAVTTKPLTFQLCRQFSVYLNNNRHEKTY